MSDAPKSAILFAAGFGTRMRPLTDKIPKPLIPVSGRALIDHALDQVRDANIQTIVVNLHYLGGHIRSHLSDQDITFSEEQPKILDTGGGLRHAMPNLGAEPVFTMNTDAVWRGPNTLKYLAAHWEPKEMDALLLTVPKAQAIGHNGNGDFIQTSNGVKRGPGDIYTGLQIIKTDQLHQIKEVVFSLNVLWDLYLDQGRLSTLSYPGQWCDVGRPENIQLAEKLLESGDDRS